MSIFTAAGLLDVPKFSRNAILQTICSVKAPLKLPPLTLRHKNSRVEWASKYLKMDITLALFTDETWATLDGLDDGEKGWVYFGDERRRRLRRQQQGGGVMIWARIIGDRLVGPIKALEGVNVTSAAYCNLLNESLVPWLDDIPLSLLRDFVFMHDNAPSHSARTTHEFLTTLSIQDEELMIWPPSSSDLNPIEKFWAIIKRDIMAMDGNFNQKTPCGKPSTLQQGQFHVPLSRNWSIPWIRDFLM